MKLPPDQVKPAIGTLMFDTAKGRFGEYHGMSLWERRLCLRPVGGGIEWDVAPEHVRTATEEERAEHGRVRS